MPRPRQAITQQFCSIGICKGEKIVKSHKLIELLRIESNEINVAFQKASLEGQGTPQEVADRREPIVQAFFEKYFPYPFRIVKGNIVDINERTSNSIDCIILNPSHPYTIDKKNGRPSIVFADATDFAIEIKPDLSQKSEVERSLEQMISVKKLDRVDNSKIMSIIFSNTTYANIETLINNIAAYHIENNIKYVHQFDLICINNRGIVLNFTEVSRLKIGDDMPHGLYFMDTKEDSVAWLLKFMNSTGLSEMRIRESILIPYLKKFLLGNRRVIGYHIYS